MKYDFKLDMNTENSVSIILNQIQPKTKVLEFGPAMGRMTKYLKEVLKCEVYIVEIDKDGFKSSMQFAVDGVLGNAETMEWVNKFQGIKFDYIIFADVIEHLKNPEEVILNANNLLEYQGRLIISVPNVAHNSVIIDLINNEFNYSDVGLLDNTHIKFFTYYTLKEFLNRCDLIICNEKATYAKAFETEFQNDYDMVSGELAEKLKSKEFGDVYQYIFTCIKKEYYTLNSENIIIEKNITKLLATDTFKIYIDNGEGFNENNTLTKNIFMGKNQLSINLADFKIDNPIRLDFTEESCILKLEKLSVDGADYSTKDLNGNFSYNHNNIYIFLNADPILNVNGVTPDADNLSIEFTIYKLFTNDIENEYLDVVNSYLNDITLKSMNLEAGKNSEIFELKEKLEIVNAEMQHKEEKVYEMIEIQEEIQNSLDLYKIHYNAAINQREELKIQLAEITSTYNSIISSNSWRLTKPIRKAADFIKKILKSNRYTITMYKVLSNLKNEGVKSTSLKITRKLSSKKKIRKYNTENILTDVEKTRQEKTIFKNNIKFSILVPLYNTPKNFLREMIQSVQNQTYKNWELCLADGSDEGHNYIEEDIKLLINKDDRIKYRKLEKNYGISENTNACIEMATGDYIGLFDHDDLLHPAALFEVMKVIDDENADFIYTDENTFSDKPDDAYCPHFKPDFAIDTLRANNYICHFTVFSRKLLKNVGLFRSECDGSQDFDMVLRLTEKAAKIVHIPKILYYWRAHKNSVASDVSSKPYVIEAAIKAVSDHLSRMNIEGEVVNSSIISTYKTNYKLNGYPLVSIIIPNKDHSEDLRKCINSIIEKSTYKNYEIIVIENNSETVETFKYYDTLKTNSFIKIVQWEGKFNYSAINNYGFKFSNGEHIILLNNDIEIITPNWIEEMLMYSQRQDVGAVGVKLYYEDNTIQHAGIGIGLLTLAGHYHRNFPRSHPGYMARLTYTQNVSAVTAACMMIRRNVFAEVNGLDEGFEVAFNDVDLCMRIRKAGYLIVFTPYAEAYHYESKSRGYEDTHEKQQRFKGEVLRFQNRWRKELDKGDPYYNPNFTLDKEDFSIR